MVGMETTRKTRPPYRIDHVAPGEAAVYDKATGWPAGVIRRDRSQRFRFGGLGRIQVTVWYALPDFSSGWEIGPYGSMREAAREVHAMMAAAHELKAGMVWNTPDTTTEESDR